MFLYFKKILIIACIALFAPTHTMDIFNKFSAYMQPSNLALSSPAVQVTPTTPSKQETSLFNKIGNIIFNRWNSFSTATRAFIAQITDSPKRSPKSLATPPTPVTPNPPAPSSVAFPPLPVTAPTPQPVPTYVTPNRAAKRLGQIARHTQPTANQPEHPIISAEKTNQTQRFLTNKKFHNSVKNVWDRNFIEHESLVKNIVQREQDFKKTHTAVYHSHDHSLILLQDFYRLLYLWEYKQFLRPDYIFLRHWHDASESSTVNDFCNEYSSIKVDDHLREVSRQILSVNISLLGNSQNSGESTFDYFLNNRSISNSFIIIRGKLEILFKKYRFNQKYIDDFIRLSNSIETDKGALVQIFIPHTLLDSHVYLAQPGGHPQNTPYSGRSKKPIAAKDFCATRKRYTKISSVIAHLKAHAATLPSDILDSIQARMLFTRQFLDPAHNDVKIFRYTTIADDTMSHYHKKLNTLFEQMIAEKNKRLKFSADTPSAQPPATISPPVTTLFKKLTKHIQPWAVLYFKKDWEGLKKAIQASTDIHRDIQKNTTIVDRVITDKNLSLISVLIEKGITFSLAQLYTAGDIERVKEAIATSKTITYDITQKFDDFTFIDLLIVNKDREMISLLIDKGVIFNLAQLYQVDDIKRVRTAIATSTNITRDINSESKTNYGYKKFIDLVSINKDREMISLLIDKGVVFNVAQLYQAEDIERVKIAISASTDITRDINSECTTNYWNQRFIDLVIDYNDITMISLLIDKGVIFNLAQLYKARDIKRVKAAIAASSTNIIHDANQKYGNSTLINLVVRNKDKDMASLLRDKGIVFTVLQLYQLGDLELFKKELIKTTDMNILEDLFDNIMSENKVVYLAGLIEYAPSFAERGITTLIDNKDWNTLDTLIALLPLDKDSRIWDHLPNSSTFFKLLSDNHIVKLMEKALSANRLEVVKKFISVSNEVLTYGYGVSKINLLHIAARHSNLAIIKYLVSQSKDPVLKSKKPLLNTPDNKGKTPLDYALESARSLLWNPERTAVVEYLIQHGATADPSNLYHYEQYRKKITSAAQQKSQSNREKRIQSAL